MSESVLLYGQCYRVTVATRTILHSHSPPAQQVEEVRRVVAHRGQRHVGCGPRQHHVLFAYVQARRNYSNRNTHKTSCTP